jgi:hypothetical protein
VRCSRLENGQGVPQPRDIRDLINFYGAERPVADRIRRYMNDGRRQAWWKEYSSVISESVDTFLDYESGASVIRIYAPMVLPGLLQTGQYARRLLTTLYPHYRPEEVDKLVQVRLRRQETVLRSDDDATRLLAVIDEAALRRAESMGDSVGAREQLRHIREISQRRNVSIQILPLSAGLHAGVMGIFTVFQFADDIDRDIVSVETHSGDRHLEEQSSVLEYLRLFDAITHRALDHTESRELLDALIDSIPDHQEKN